LEKEGDIPLGKGKEISRSSWKRDETHGMRRISPPNLRGGTKENMPRGKKESGKPGWEGLGGPSFVGQQGFPNNQPREERNLRTKKEASRLTPETKRSRGGKEELLRKSISGKRDCGLPGKKFQSWERLGKSG